MEKNITIKGTWTVGEEDLFTNSGVSAKWWGELLELSSAGLEAPARVAFYSTSY